MIWRRRRARITFNGSHECSDFKKRRALISSEEGLMSQHRMLKAALLILSTLSPPAFSDTTDSSRAAVYTAAQAARGKVAVESSCAICHLQSLRGRVGEDDEMPAMNALPRKFQDFIKTGYVPPLVGEEFLAKWSGKSVVELVKYVAGASGSFPTAGMDDQTWAEIGAYVLQMNGAPAGDQELTASTSATVDAVVGLMKAAAR
jgi:hypothetical protein